MNSHHLMKLKSVFLLVFSVFLALLAKATQQVPDILIYESHQLKLETGWGHPSPLETYFSQNDLRYPFTMISTGNYRGHVATWYIDQGKFFLTEIDVRKEKYSPEKYQVTSKNPSFNSKDTVFADWFSGVLVGNLRKKERWEIIKTYYIHVLNGEVQGVEVLDDADKESLGQLSLKDTANQELINKYRMVVLNENYISYYYRLNGKDTVTIGEQKAHFRRRMEGSPVLSYFSNDHLKWPYNWMNAEQTGAPNCQWEIRNDSVFLKEIGLLSNLSIREADREVVSLQETLSLDQSADELFAGWIDGVYFIEYGKMEIRPGLSDLKQFKPSEFVFYRFSNGVVLESASVGSDFNFREMPQDTPAHLKRMIEDL